MARKVQALTLAIMMVFSLLLAVPALAATKTTVDMTHPGDELYVRKGPHKGNTPVVDIVKDNQKITVLESDDADDPEGWSKIRVESTGAVGYLKNKYIKSFGFDNSDGEIDKHEDNDTDYSDADDNDGHKGEQKPATPPKTVAFAKAISGEVATPHGGDVNIRAEAISAGKIIGEARSGQELTVIGKAGSWYHVENSGGTKGYVFDGYVIVGDYAHVTANSGLHLREGAGTNSDSIKTLANHSEIIVLDRGSEWSFVLADNIEGYVNNDYYELDKDASTEATKG